MKTIKTLFVAQMFFKTCMVLISLFLIALIVLFIHSFISPKSYEKVLLKIDSRGVNFVYDKTNPLPPGSYAEYKQLNDKNFYFNKLTPGTKIYILMRVLFFAGVILLVIKELINFLNSVKEYSSFFVNNYLYFKRIGFYSVILVVYGFLSDLGGTEVSMKFPDEMVHSVQHYINIPYYFFMCTMVILSFVASMVFKEGERLRIENELTV